MTSRRSIPIASRSSTRARRKSCWISSKPAAARSPKRSRCCGADGSAGSAVLADTGGPVAGDDDMIQHADAQGLAGLLQAAGQGEIVVAGRGISGGGVVDQEDGLGGVLDGRAEH